MLIKSLDYLGMWFNIITKDGHLHRVRICNILHATAHELQTIDGTVYRWE